MEKSCKKVSGGKKKLSDGWYGSRAYVAEWIGELKRKGGVEDLGLLVRLRKLEWMLEEEEVVRRGILERAEERTRRMEEGWEKIL